MANTISKHTIIDGSRHLIVKIYLESDGASGELTDSILIDASTYSPAFTDCAIKHIHSSLVGFSAVLEWDATTDVPIVNLPEYEFNLQESEMDYSIPNNAGAGKTGDILITTTGFTAAGDRGTITIHLVKKSA